MYKRQLKKLSLLLFVTLVSINDTILKSHQKKLSLDKFKNSRIKNYYICSPKILLTSRSI
jgi:hypothetical protein